MLHFFSQPFVCPKQIGQIVHEFDNCKTSEEIQKPKKIPRREGLGDGRAGGQSPPFSLEIFLASTACDLPQLNVLTKVMVGKTEAQVTRMLVFSFFVDALY